jgi:hypothetical protein
MIKSHLLISHQPTVIPQTPNLHVRKRHCLAAEMTEFIWYLCEITALMTVWLQVAELRRLGTGRSKLLRRIVKLSFQNHVGSTQSFCDC